MTLCLAPRGPTDTMPPRGVRIAMNVIPVGAKTADKLTRLPAKEKWP
jgi:hypothetical protein